MGERRRGSDRVHNVQGEMDLLTEHEDGTHTCKVCLERLGLRHNARRHSRRHIDRSMSCSSRSRSPVNRSLEFQGALLEAYESFDISARGAFPNNSASEDSEVATPAKEVEEQTVSGDLMLDEAEIFAVSNDDGVSETEVDEEVTDLAVLPEWSVSEIEEAGDIRNISHPLPEKTASPADIFNLWKFTHGISDRAAINILEIIKQNLDFSGVTQTDIRRPRNLHPEIVEHSLCRHCSEDLVAGICTDGCGPTKKGDIFASSSLSALLTQALEGETVNFWDPATYQVGGIISDSTDGSAHREFMDRAEKTSDGFKIITLIVNTDGVQLHRNSNVSIWPTLLVINELPREKRYDLMHMVIYALWQGIKGETQDVPSSAMLAALQREISQINQEGLTVHVNGVTELVKVYVSEIAADLPAKADLLNIIQHNGFYGCTICENPGFTAKKGTGRNHSYAPRLPKEQYRRRTKKRMMKQAQFLTNSDEAKGMRGVPHVSVFQHFDCATGVVIDDMHAVYIGIVKKLMSIIIWGEDKLPCRLNKEQQNALEVRLRSIRPPPHIKHFPTTFQLSHWNASEVRTWFLLYSIQCFRGILKTEYLNHWTLLVEAIALLSKPDISTLVDLPRAEELLERFCSKYSDLYGENNYVINVHYLEHLASYVALHGSLPENSLYAFESFNGVMTRQCHGTNVVRKTILRQLYCYQALKRRVCDLTDPVQKRLIARLRRRRTGIPTEGTGWKSYGRPTKEVVSFPAGIWTHCSGHDTVVLTRVELGKLCVWTEGYQRATKRSSRHFFVRRKADGHEFVVEIRKIVLCRSCKKLLLLADNFPVVPYQVGTEIMSHMYAVRRAGGQSSTSICICPDQYLFFACSIVVFDGHVCFSVSQHFESSD